MVFFRLRPLVGLRLGLKNNIESGPGDPNDRHLKSHMNKVHEGLKNHIESSDPNEKSLEIKKNLEDDLPPITHENIPTSEDLRRHLENNKHQNDEIGTYQCKHCEKTFGSNASLIRHVRDIHEGLKNYNCNIPYPRL